MGRPTKLDDIVAKRIVDALERGNTRATAAKLGGVDPSTVRGWLSRGRKGEEPFSAFLSRVEKADAKAEDDAVQIIREAARGGTWQAAAWWLERRRPKDWARRDPYAQRAGAPARDPMAPVTVEAQLAEVETLLPQLVQHRNELRTRTATAAANEDQGDQQ